MRNHQELSLGGAYFAIFFVGFFGAIIPAALNNVWGFLIWLILTFSAGFVGMHWKQILKGNNQ